MFELIFEVVEHALLDNIKILPILFITYLIMEYVEHRSSAKLQQTVAKAGKVGPLFGGLLGVVPQCGFSGAAANFYAGGIISLGTLIAIFLSTSDEMLPILISESIDVWIIVKILCLKLAIGVIAGFIVDIISRKNKPVDVKHDIHEMCSHDHCNCEKGVFRSAVKHTLQIFIFLLVVTIVLGFVIELVGEDNLANLILNKPVIGEILAGTIGLIPNCSSSVIITKLYVSGAMGLGAMMAGLLVNSGVGVLILFRVNRNLKENLKILAILYGIGVVAGIVISFFGVAF